MSCLEWIRTASVLFINSDSKRRDYKMRISHTLSPKRLLRATKTLLQGPPASLELARRLLTDKKGLEVGALVTSFADDLTFPFMTVSLSSITAIFQKTPSGPTTLLRSASTSISLAGKPTFVRDPNSTTFPTTVMIFSSHLIIWSTWRIPSRL